MEALDRKNEDAPFSGEDSAVAGPGVVPERRGAEMPTARRLDRGSASRRIASLRVGALGLSAWVVSVGLPVREGGIHSPADVVLVVLPIVALALGVSYFARDRREATPLLA